MLAKERADELEKQEKAAAEEKKRKERNKPLTVFRSGVGKYLNTAATASTSSSQSTTSGTEPLSKKKKTTNFGFGNFGSW